MACARGDSIDMDDDFLEAVFMNENRCQDEGFAEGLADGRRKGLVEGLHLGCQKGCELGSELGFYVGFAETMKKKAAHNKNKDRLLRTIGTMTQLIESFPLTEPRNPQLHEQVEAIRAKFKQLTSLLGIQTQYTPAGGGPVGSSF